MHTDNQKIVVQFIDQIWNKSNFDALDVYLHPAYTDHSLPPALSPDRLGMQTWILATSASFDHRTVIEDQVTEGDKTMIKIRMELKHTGIWRNIPPTGKEIRTTGYRFYRLAEGKILEHWALIDGQSIETQLKEVRQGCHIAR
jgi:predicted SnoaL-like aldol condensation-catalyzing enzyme